MRVNYEPLYKRHPHFKITIFVFAIFHIVWTTARLNVMSDVCEMGVGQNSDMQIKLHFITPNAFVARNSVVGVLIDTQS